MSDPFPPEILSLLFSFSVPLAHVNELHDPDVNRQLSRRPLLRLASVCRRWRQVACSTSELWTTCWLSYTCPGLNFLWLSRTGSRPFDIVGLPILRSAGVPCTALVHVISSISPFMPRCRSLSIDYLDYDSYPSSELGDFSAPNLISCQLRGANFPFWFYQSLYRSSKLQKLSVLSEELSPLLVPVLSNLSYLHIKRFEDGVSLEVILTNAPKLRTLDISSIYILRTWGPVDPITHENLVELRLWFEFEAMETQFVFDQLALPSLKVFDLCGEGLGDWVEEDTSRFHNFLERSQCRLETFIISLDSLWLISVLRHDLMSSLQKLEYSNSDITPEFLTFLMDTTNVPDLRELKLIRAEIPDHETFSLLTNMISARRSTIGREGQPSGAKLAYFKLELTHHFMCQNPGLGPAYASQARRIKAIANASEGEADALVVDMQKWPPSRIANGSDEETDSYEGILRRN